MVTDRKIKHIFSSDGSGGIEVDEMIKMLESLNFGENIQFGSILNT